METIVLKNLSRTEKERLLKLAKSRLTELRPQQVAIPRLERRDRAPLSWPQQRLWFLDQLDAAAGAAYHMPVALRLEGELDVVALRAALQRVVERHEVLRTRFEQVDGVPMQRIDADGGFVLVEEDARAALVASSREAVLAQVLEAESQRPFDLARGPLIRGRLVRLGQAEHLLLVNQHHIVSDGWSQGILMREVSQLYAALSAGEADPLDPLPIQYLDYAVWHREWLQGDVLEQRLAFWRGHLSGAPALLALPTDRPRPAVQSYRGSSIELQLGPDLATRLKHCAEAHGVTLFMLLFAGWSLLLSRLSGQSDVVVGVPVANRPRRELEGLIGFFVNTLALRLQVDERLSVGQLLTQVRELLLSGYANQDVPFEQVVEALNPARSMGYSPLFQNMLVLQNTPVATSQQSTLRLSGEPIETGTSQFDLSLQLQEHSGGIDGTLNYASDLFDAATMQRWIGHLEVLLHAMAGDPQQTIAALPWLDSAQRRTLLQAFSAARASFPVGRATLHGRFEAQVARLPDAVAVEYAGLALTYAQLNTRANRWAHRLRAAGVGPDQLVGLCVERSLDLVVGVLAILKAGGAYVPLDPAYPPQRLAYLIEDSAPMLVLAQAACLDALPKTGVTVLVMEDAAIVDQPTHNPRVAELVAAHLAYVIYTSGSTGQPKGVMVEHAQALRLFAATEDQFGFGQEDTWTLFHSFAFDFSVWELWGALLYGGRLVVVAQQTTRSPTAFYRLLCERRVTVLNQTPTAFYQLIQAQAELQGESLPAHQLKWVVFGGEALSLRALQPWVARNGDRMPTLVNMYGITETTVHVTHRALTAADIEGEQASVVGRALADLGIYVLDGRGEPVPVGVTGELYVGGAGVARGYLRRPQLTAERFLANPFADPALPRLYRTGDLGRWRADGTLDYLGRNDDQVKIRGFRLELGEIEAALRGQPGVADAAVLAREDVPGEKRLVAYVVPEPGVTLALTGLRAALAAQLAEHQLPAAFVRLERLPLTSNGKLDRSAMPAPDSVSLLRDAYVPPETPAERGLCDVWENVLGVGRIGIDDNYFAVGGDSIRSLQIVRQARARGLALTVAAVFQHQTIRLLAREAMSANAAALAPIDLGRLAIIGSTALRADVEDVYPLTAMQATMVREYTAENRRGEGVYHVQQYFRFQQAAPSPSAMRDAFQQLAQALPILRTVLVQGEDGELLQAILREAVVDFAAESIPVAGEIEQDSWLHTRVLRDRAEPFGVGAPLFRVRWFASGVDQFDLLFSIHHAIDDGWGNQNFLGELFELYTRLRQGGSVDLTVRPNVFKEYVALERETTESAAAETFWAPRLERPLGTALPPRPAATSEAGGVTLRIPPERLAPLQAFAREQSVSLKAVLLAAYLRLLGGVEQALAPCVGVVSNGRSDRLSDPLGGLGLFWNLLPFGLDLEQGPAPADHAALVRAVQAELSLIESFPLYPASQVAEHRQGRAPFQATFNFIDFHNAAQLQHDEALVLRYQHGHDKFHLPLNYAFSVDRNANAVIVHVEYDPVYFDAAAIDALNYRLQQYLAAFTAAAAGLDHARVGGADAGSEVELT